MNKNAKKIFEFLIENPNSSIKTITDEVWICIKTFHNHIKKLIDDKYVTVAKNVWVTYNNNEVNSENRYYPHRSRLWDDELKVKKAKTVSKIIAGNKNLEIITWSNIIEISWWWDIIVLNWTRMYTAQRFNNMVRSYNLRKNNKYWIDNRKTKWLSWLPIWTPQEDIDLFKQYCSDNYDN